MTLSAIEKEVLEMFDKIFQGLPKNWCPNCHTLGTAFPNDTICGNCNYSQIGTFESFLAAALRRVAEETVAAVMPKENEYTLEEASSNPGDDPKLDWEMCKKTGFNSCRAEMHQNFIKFTEKV